VAEVAGIRVEFVALEFRTSGIVSDFGLTRLDGEGTIGGVAEAHGWDDLGGTYVLGRSSMAAD
jgi:hypothetical protein